MLRLFRNKSCLRIFSVFFALHLCFDWLFPTMSYGLTSGPAMPEFSSFEPVGTSELVNVSSGDFVYNIPLLDVEGYPINLAYHSGVSMDDEASMVGLGWSLNLGAVNRTVRGLPDDFAGDVIKQERNVRPSISAGVTGTLGAEAIGNNVLGVNGTLGVNWNNYRGYGYEFNLGFTSKPSAISSAAMLDGIGYGLSLGYSSDGGIGINPSLSFYDFVEDLEDDQTTFSTLSTSIGFNSRVGLQSMSLTSEGGTYHVIEGSEPGIRHLVGSSTGSSFSFATPTYSPSGDFPSISNNFTFYGSAGLELFWSDGFGGISGYIAANGDAVNQLSYEAYGYHHAEKAQSRNNVLQDFNRFNDIPFIPGASRNLPVSQQTYDSYMATGQGMMGQFRSHRNDLGVMYDPNVLNISGKEYLSAQLGALSTFDAGGNLNFVVSSSRSGRWDNYPVYNQLSSKVGAVQPAEVKLATSEADPLYEASYFQKVGEMSPTVNEDFYASIGGTAAVSPELIKRRHRSQTSNRLVGRNGQTFTPDRYAQTRAVRQTVFQALEASEAASYGLQSNISFYDNSFELSSLSNFLDSNGDFTTTDQTILNRNAGNRQDHHISEISVLRQDGSRYIYGLPVYNWKLREVTFNVSGNSLVCDDGLVRYTAGTDNSTANENGIDHYFSANETPAYPYAHLLTAVVSSDYVDQDNVEGPSDGDLGNWHKFNYWNASSDLAWRTPVDMTGGTDPLASFNKGLLSDPDDDKGSYTYGTKEVYYVHSIETKHYVAVFEYGDRSDSHPTTGENGGQASTNPLQRLESITLYAKEELKAHAVNSNNPLTPIKTVHFGYFSGTNELTPGTPNSTSSSQGKLTLATVSFSYGSSDEARLSPYRFYYADPDHDKSINTAYNPNYHLKAYDRWGSYSPPCENYEGDCECSQVGKMDNPEFPYTDQSPLPGSSSWDYNGAPADMRLADAYAQVWALHTIITPSGGQINVDYESHDYAYVQDKMAMQMVGISGFSASATGPATNELYRITSNGWTNHEYLIIDLPENFSFHPDLPTQDRNEYFRQTMLSEIGEFLYLNVYTNLNRSFTNDAGNSFVERFEQVPVWVEWESDNSGLINPSGTPTQAYIKIKSLGVRDNGKGGLIQGVAKSTINYLWLNHPRLVNNPVNSGATNEGIVKGLLGFANDMKALFNGRMKALIESEYAREIDAGRSWVRLMNPDGMKHGGGVRVSRITMSDRWSEMTNASSYNDQSYGQTYTYTTEEPVPGMPGYTRTISSGVAGYEPILGGDENPFRKPRVVEKKFIAAMDERHFLLEPIAESLYPGPQIVYSKVKVANLTDENVTRHGSGYVEHEFYTARDYPTFFEEIPLDAEIVNSETFLWKFTKQNQGATAVQGYAIRRNDMHGKPKAKSVFGQGQANAISEMRYYYRTKGGEYVAGARNELDNTMVPSIDRNGALVYRTMGQTIDLVFDSQAQESIAEGMDIRANVNGSNVVPFLVFLPIPVPTAFFPVTKSETFFRSMTATKVVDSYAILDRVEAYDLGALVATTNEAWDAETGEVLLTRTLNEFQDPRHQFSYPAHWMYEGMGQAYQNTKATFANLDLGTLSSEVASIFQPGDEVYWSNGAYSGIGWVLDVGSTSVSIVDEQGSLLQNSNNNSDQVEQLTIFRSGRRNLATTPVGGLLSEFSPLVDDGQGGLELDVTKDLNILNSSVATFSDDKQIEGPIEDYSNCGSSGGTFYYPAPTLSACDRVSDEANPYYVGIKGNWHAGTAYSYLTERTQYSLNPSFSDLRNTGFLVDFSPFWVPPGSAGAAWTTSSANWTFTEEATLVGTEGGVLESRNAIDIYSSAVYGYKRSVPVASVVNGRYQEVGFDGFEDYDLTPAGCTDRHWQLQVKNGDIETDISDAESHSGKYSVLLDVNKELYSIQPFGSGACAGNGSGTPFTLGECDFSGLYAPALPTGTEKHVVSFWVRAEGQSNSTNWNSYLAAGLYGFEAFGCGSGGKVSFSSELNSISPIIEGWQRVEMIVSVDPTGFVAGDTWGFSIISNDDRGVYVDDIRVHPFNAMMTSYVYDPETMRLRATLDENNFTTFYQYNDKGELVSVKVETEDGIKTLEEARYHSAK